MPRTWDAFGNDLGYVEDETDRRRAAAADSIMAVQDANQGGSWQTINGQTQYVTASGQLAGNYNQILASTTPAAVGSTTGGVAIPEAARAGSAAQQQLFENISNGNSADNELLTRGFTQDFVNRVRARAPIGSSAQQVMQAISAEMAAMTAQPVQAGVTAPAVGGTHPGSAPTMQPPSQQNPVGAGGTQQRFKINGTLDAAGGGYFTDAQTGETVYVDRYGNLSRDGGRTYTAQAGSTAQQLSTGQGPSLQPTQSGTVGQVVQQQPTQSGTVGQVVQQPTQSGTHNQVVAAPSVSAGAVTAPPAQTFPATQPYTGVAPDWALFQRDPAAYQAWLNNQAAVAARVASDPRNDAIMAVQDANPGGVWTQNAQGQPVFRTADGRETTMATLGINPTPGPYTIPQPVPPSLPAQASPVAHAVAQQAAPLDAGTTVRPGDVQQSAPAARYQPFDYRPMTFDAESAPGSLLNWQDQLQQQFNQWMAAAPSQAVQPNQDLASYAAALPNPNQVVARNWMRLPQTSRDFLLGTYEAMGWDPNDVTETIGRTAPTWQAPRYGMVRA